MKKLGWAYLALFGIDVVLTIVASFVPAVAGVSNKVSSLVLLASMAVIILAALNKLRPRALFLTMSITYVVIGLGFGIFLGVLLVMKLGPAGVPQNLSPQFIASQLTWYLPVHWGLTILMTALAATGFVVYSKGEPAAVQAQ